MVSDAPGIVFVGSAMLCCGKNKAIGVGRPEARGCCCYSPLLSLSCGMHSSFQPGKGNVLESFPVSCRTQPKESCDDLGVFKELS